MSWHMLHGKADCHDPDEPVGLRRRGVGHSYYFEARNEADLKV